MNSLLQRQIRKHLSEAQKSDATISKFLDAVNRSYNNFDEQYTMQQRAMAISSKELFEANDKLRKEAEAQQEVINKLKRVVETLEFYKLSTGDNENTELSELELVEVIDGQTKEIVEINKQRETLLKELASQNQELSDYAHMVSHDLKSPLRSIDALTAWLKDDYKDKFDEQGNLNLDLIRTNVEKMDKLINGILQYSTISKNQEEVYDVDIDNLITEILEAIDIPKHIKITTLSKLPVVKGDKYRLQQLFQNLIGNAIKYNDKSEGVIEVSFESQKKFWQFAVKDNGKGIDSKYHDKIFNTFEKLENTPDSSGIGLSIVKKIVNLYNGSIWLESSLNQGSTFYFTIQK